VLDSSNTFKLYVHRERGRLIGLCAELRAIVEGSTIEEVLASAKVLIAASATSSGLADPRITVRLSPNSKEIASGLRQNR
jgi:hypothetical protein